MDAQRRRRSGFRPATLNNYTSSATLWVQFCLVHNVSLTAPTQDDVGAYTEFLLRGQLAPATIRNYMTALRAFYMWWSQPQAVAILNSHATRLTIRGIDYTVESSADTRTAVTENELFALLVATESHQRFFVMRVGILLSFFAYLRLSNLVPPSVADFDPSRHSVLADVAPRADGLVFGLKWSKTRQHGCPTQSIPVPSLPHSRFCPQLTWDRYIHLLSYTHTQSQSPLLLSTAPPLGQVVTASMFRAALRELLLLAGLQHRGITPHSFRRGGASHSYASGVPLSAIMFHGTWRSEAVKAYLMASPPFESSVVTAFRDAFR